MNATNDDLINQIAEGKAILLSADDICSRLSVSRSTFDRWVRNGAPFSVKDSLLNEPEFSFTERRLNQEDGKLSFPPADIRIGNSPRWSLNTFKSWLAKNITNK